MTRVEVLAAEWQVLVVDSEHDPGCPGGGDYCSGHCPVPVQRFLDPNEVLVALETLAAQEGERGGAEVLDQLGRPMTPPDKFGYDGGYIVIDGKRYQLTYRDEAPEYPPFPCQDTGPNPHPPHDWEAEQWPQPGRFRCPGWRGQAVTL